MNKLIYTEKCKEIISKQGKIDINQYLVGSKIDERAFSFLLFLESQVIHGENIEDLLFYDGIPLYYFNRPTIFLKLKSLITCITILQRVTQEFGIDFLVETDSEIMKITAEKIFNLKVEETPIDIPSGNSSKSKTKNKLIFRQISGVFQYLKFRPVLFELP